MSCSPTTLHLPSALNLVYLSVILDSTWEDSSALLQRLLAFILRFGQQEHAACIRTTLNNKDSSLISSVHFISGMDAVVILWLHNCCLATKLHYSSTLEKAAWFEIPFSLFISKTRNSRINDMINCDIFMMASFSQTEIGKLQQEWNECIPAVCLSLLLYYKYSEREAHCCVSFPSSFPSAGWMKVM